MIAKSTSVALLAGVALLGACHSTMTSPIVPASTALSSVSPSGGSSGVSTGASITIQFNHAMMTGMQAYITLHEGDVTGPLVPCTITWSADSATITLTPTAPLKPATMYTVHMGGSMRDANGYPVNLTANGMMGGQWATGSMMNGGGMMGGGGPMSGQEMGQDWAGSNGMYGMIFTFTTA